MPESAAATGAPPRPGIRFALGLTGACALAGLCLALFLGEYPMRGSIALFLIAAALATQAAVGLSGLAAFSLLGGSFFLLKRFDEGFALPVGDIELQLMYLLAAGFAAAIALHLAVYRVFAPPLPRADHAFLRRLGFTMLAFAAVAAVAMLANRVFPDPHARQRLLWPEIVTLGLILIPATFALLIPRSPMSRATAALAIRFIVGLGGFAGLIMAAFGLLPAGITGMLGWTEVTGGTLDLVRGRLPLGHANSVAAVIMLIMPTALIVGLRARRLHWRLFGLACAGSMFCGVLFSLSRSALLCLMIAMALAFAYYLAVSESRQRFVALAASALISLLLLGVAAYLFAQFDFSRFWSRRYHEEASTERRISSMRTALVVWQHHPVLGVGPDAVFPRLEIRPDWMPRRRDEISPIIVYRGHISAENPHNVYLSALAEFGAAGFALFAAMVAQPAVFLWRRRRFAATPEARDLLAAATISIFAFLLMGMFEAVLMTGIRVNLVFWLFVALFLRYAMLAAPAPRGEESAP